MGVAAESSRRRIFICYRREDTGVAVGRLAEDLRKHFSRDDVVKDIAGIAPGVDRRDALRQRLAACAGVLVVIGPKWLGEPDDHVTHEVAASLEQPEIRVFPVLIGNTEMPNPEDLPGPLRPLAQCPAWRVSWRHWTDDVALLVAALSKVPGVEPLIQPAASVPEPPRAAPVAPLRPTSAEARPQAEPQPDERTQADERTQPDEPVGPEGRKALGAVEPQPEAPPAPVAAAPERAVGSRSRLGVAAALIAAAGLGAWLLRHLPIAPGVSPSASARMPTRTNASDGLDYVFLPAGTFTMGCVPRDADCDRDEKPRQRVTLTKGFWLARTETTVAAYKRFVRATGRAMAAEPASNKGWSKGDHPIVNVSWFDADAFCQWSGGKLPTEAQWEYAARGGLDGDKFPWGDAASHQFANYGADQCCEAKVDGRDRWPETAPAGSFAPNGFGLFDMAGNVWEWVRDGYSEDPLGDGSTDSVDPTGVATSPARVLRGGAWDSNPESLRVSNRLRREPGYWSANQGFRCSRDASP